MPNTTINPGPDYRLLRPPCGDDPGELVQEGDEIYSLTDKWSFSDNWPNGRQSPAIIYRRRVEQPEPFKAGDWVRVVKKSENEDCSWQPAMDSCLGGTFKVLTANTGMLLLDTPKNCWWFLPASLEPADAPIEPDPWKPSPGKCLERGGGKAWVACRIPDELQVAGLVWLGTGSDGYACRWREDGISFNSPKHDLIGQWVEPESPEPTDAEIAEAIRNSLAKREMLFCRRYVSNVRELVDAWRENGGGDA